MRLKNTTELHGIKGFLSYVHCILQTLINMFLIVMLEEKNKVFLNPIQTHYQNPSGSCMSMVLGTEVFQSIVQCKA